MLRTKSALVVAALGLWLSTTATALEQQAAWIHVEVVESGDKAEKINVNLPLALAEVALEVLPDEATANVAEKFHEHGMSLADLRKLWAELKSAGDAELVTVESNDEKVRVVREDDLIRVRVEDRGGEALEQVRVDIPVPVVDALLSGEGEELNLRAAIQQLENRRGDIVTVDDGDSKVRVWISSGS